MGAGASTADPQTVDQIIKHAQDSLETDRQEAKEFFKNLDKNKDGNLSRAEMKEHINEFASIKYNIEFSPKDIDEFIKAYDKDDKGEAKGTHGGHVRDNDGLSENEFLELLADLIKEGNPAKCGNKKVKDSGNKSKKRVWSRRKDADKHKLKAQTEMDIFIKPPGTRPAISFQVKVNEKVGNLKVIIKEAEPFVVMGFEDNIGLIFQGQVLDDKKDLKIYKVLESSKDGLAPTIFLFDASKPELASQASVDSLAERQERVNAENAAAAAELQAKKDKEKADAAAKKAKEKAIMDAKIQKKLDGAQEAVKQKALDDAKAAEEAAAAAAAKQAEADAKQAAREAYRAKLAEDYLKLNDAEVAEREAAEAAQKEADKKAEEERAEELKALRLAQSAAESAAAQAERSQKEWAKVESSLSGNTGDEGDEAADFIKK